MRAPVASTAMQDYIVRMLLQWINDDIQDPGEVCISSTFVVHCSPLAHNDALSSRTTCTYVRPAGNIKILPTHAGFKHLWRVHCGGTFDKC